MKKIQRFSTTRQRTEEAFGFYKLVQIEVKTCLSGSDSDSPDEISVLAEGKTSPLLTTALQTFDDAVDKFDAALKDSAGSPTSKAASAADTERDQAWRGCNAYVKAMTQHPLADTRTIAEEAKAMFDKYGDPTDKPQTEESGILHNLLQDLRALSNEKRTALSLDVWINNLDEKENAFLAAVKERTAEEAARIVGIVKQSRQATEAAYGSMVETVNALVLLEGEADYATFIDHMNVLIDRQKTVLKTRSTLNAKKAEQTETTPGETR